MACEKRFFPNGKHMNTASLSSPQAYAEGSSAAEILSVSAADIAAYILIAVFITMIIVLTNRHIRTSREIIRKSDRLLESERANFERRLAERTAALVRSEEQRFVELERNATFGELSKGLFHDLMNPLSSLTIYAEHIGERSDLSETARDMASKMTNTSRRLNSYMESVRRSIGSGKTDDSSSELSKEIGIVMDILGYKARMGGVEMVSNINDKVILNVHPVRLHQLLLNLVSNAIESCQEYDLNHNDSPARDHRVTISVQKDSEFIQIKVSDTGIGISKDDQRRLFTEMFTTKKKGTGIGLLTIHSVVQKDLNGSIEVQSEPDIGTTFQINIPLRD